MVYSARLCPTVRIYLHLYCLAIDLLLGLLGLAMLTVCIGWIDAHQEEVGRPFALFCSIFRCLLTETDTLSLKVFDGN